MKTVPSNMVAVNKSGAASTSGKQQTIVITKPGRPAAQQIIVVTTASGLRTVQTLTTQAASGNCSINQQFSLSGLMLTKLVSI